MQRKAKVDEKAEQIRYILFAHENLASCARAFLQIAVLENLAVE